MMDGWNVLDSQHTHTKLENDLEIDNQLIINSAGGKGKSFLYRDHRRLWILTDRDGDGNFESPHPLFIDHEVNAARLFNNLIWTEGNLPVEAGTFTPTLKQNTGDSIIHSVQVGNYIRQGNLLFFSLTLGVKSYSSTLDYMQIADLPFPAKLIDSMRIGLNLIDAVGFNMPSDCITLNPTIASGRNFLDVYWSQKSLQNRPIDLSSEVSASFSIRISGTYAI